MNVVQHEEQTGPFLLLFNLRLGYGQHDRSIWVRFALPFCTATDHLCDPPSLKEA
jgi:hypothetical protein